MPTKLLQKIKTYRHSPVFWSIFVVTFFTFGSRILGFFRQFLILDKLSKLESDLLISADKIPQFISTFLLMGTIYSSVLPIASGLEKRDDQSDVSNYLNLVSLTLFAVIIVLTALAMIFIEPLLKIFGPEIWDLAGAENQQSEYILTARILLLSPLIFAIQAIFGVFLTLKKKFLVYSLAGIISNLGSITALLLVQSESLKIADGDFIKVSIGMVWGGLLASTLFLWASLRNDFCLPRFFGSKKEVATFSKKNWSRFRLDLVKTWKLFLPRIFLIDGFYAASFLINPIATSEGQVTAFDIGTSIQGAFFTVITSLGTVFFPNLSKLFNKYKTSSQIFWRHLRKYTLTALFLGFGVTLLTAFGAELIMYIYKQVGRGQGNEDYIVLIAQIASLSLVFRSVREILSKYFYVRQRLWQPVILSVIGVASLFTTTLLLLYSFGQDPGIATSLGLVAYNFAWVLVSLIYIYTDYRDREKNDPDQNFGFQVKKIPYISKLQLEHDQSMNK